MNEPLKNPHTRPVEPFRRFVSVVIDVLIVFFFGEMLFAYVAIPIINNYYQGTELGDRAYQIQLDSDLFTTDDDGAISAYESDDYPMAVYRYYVVSGLASTPLTADEYYEQMLGRGSDSTLFDWSASIDPTTPWKISYTTSRSSEVESLYKTLYQDAINDLEDNNAEYKEINVKLGNRQDLGRLICLAPMILIAYVIIPPFMKNGATIGELSLGIAHTNALGYKITRGQSAFRGISFIIINYLGLFLGGPIISFIFVLARKDRRSLTDLLALTAMVDSRTSVIFASANEAEEFDSRIEAVQTNARNVRENAIKEIEAERIGKKSKK